MRFGLLLGLASTALARLDRRDSGHTGAIHPFAKYRNLAAGADITSSVTTSEPTPTRPPLECFQVAEPVLTPSGVTRRDTSQIPGFLPTDQKPIGIAGDVDDIVDALSPSPSPCAVVLMVHTFANSYGAPFVGTSKMLLFCFPNQHVGKGILWFLSTYILISKLR